ncbi:hypothetical protein BJX70DRAFT_404200 [Aspergillus crustosus]
MEISGWETTNADGLDCSVKHAFRAPFSEYKPHAMLMLAHDDQCDESVLLDVELLAITKFMAMYLGNKVFETLNIFPVMAFSFMGTKAESCKLISMNVDSQCMPVNSMSL